MPNFDLRYKSDIIDEYEYNKNSLNLIKIKKAYHSQVFGGPIFNAMGGFRNPLRKNLYEVRNLIVGYFDLRHIRISNNLFVDIQIIISDPTHTDITALGKIKKWHQKI
jgi:hypothetical protein